MCYHERAHSDQAEEDEGLGRAGQQIEDFEVVLLELDFHFGTLDQVLGLNLHKYYLSTAHMQIINLRPIIQPFIPKPAAPIQQFNRGADEVDDKTDKVDKTDKEDDNTDEADGRDKADNTDRCLICSYNRTSNQKLLMILKPWSCLFFIAISQHNYFGSLCSWTPKNYFPVLSALFSLELSSCCTADAKLSNRPFSRPPYRLWMTTWVWQTADTS